MLEYGKGIGHYKTSSPGRISVSGELGESPPQKEVKSSYETVVGVFIIASITIN